ATAPSRAHGRAFDALVESRGLEGVVSRVPAARDLAALYAAADVVCVPRHDEDPFHAVALEAIGARRPIVSTLYPGADEYVRTGANGLLYEAGDVERLGWRYMSLEQLVELAADVLISAGPLSADVADTLASTLRLDDSQSPLGPNDWWERRVAEPSPCCGTWPPRS
ncbi:MAG: glycosyltransferase, partial [Pseudomonadota bacterium]